MKISIAAGAGYNISDACFELFATKHSTFGSNSGMPKGISFNISDQFGLKLVDSRLTSLGMCL